MNKTINITNLYTVSESNTKEHWGKSYARHKLQKNCVKLSLLEHQIPKRLPVQVSLVRSSSQLLDDDNLQSAFKYIRDTIADYFIEGKLPGRADADPRITWKYDQEKGPTKSIRITFDWPD